MLRTKLALLLAMAPLPLAWFGGVAVVGCKPVTVLAGQDAAAFFRDCPKKPIPFCDAMAPGAAGGCRADTDAANALVRELPPGVTYPLGCVANLVAPIADGDCRVAATCSCVKSVSDAGTEAPAGWSCFP